MTAAERQRLRELCDACQRADRAVDKSVYEHGDRADALEASERDAERYRWLRDNNARVIECVTTRRGYRSTAPGAEWEEWDEHDGWIVSTMNINADPFPTMDAAIDAARTGEPTT